MAIDPKLVSIKEAKDLPIAEAQSTSDFLFFEDQVLKKSPMSNIYDKVISGIKGVATQTNAPTVYTAEAYPNGLFETYVVRTPLTMPNSWGSAVTQAELDANSVYFDVDNGVVTKSSNLKFTILDDSITPEKTKSSTSLNTYLFGAGNSSNTGGSNTATGKGALSYSLGAGASNSAYGMYAMRYSQANSNNSAFGFYSLSNQLNCGDDNSAFGNGSMYNNTGNRNSAFGKGSLDESKGDDNSAFGFSAGTGVVNGTKTLSIGSGSGCIGDLSYFIAIGSDAKATKNNQAVIGNENIGENVFFGNIKQGGAFPHNIYYADVAQYNYFLAGSGRANFSDTTALFYGNTAVGHLALENVNDSMMNTAMGHQALQKLTGGADHSAFGAGALQKQETGVGCTAMGRLALANTVHATNNTGLGDTALEYNIEGNLNTAVGYSAGIKSGGSNNTLMGVFAGGYITGKLMPGICTFNNCNAFGTGSMQYNITGDNNNLFGYTAGHRLTGADNSGFGHESLVNGSNISRNTAIGAGSGFWLQTGNDNVFVGNNAGRDGQVRTVSGTTVIGATACSTRDNEIVIGKNTDTHVTLAGVEFTKAQLIALKALV